MGLNNNTELLNEIYETLSENSANDIDALLNKTITKLQDSSILRVYNYAFSSCYNLSYVNLPNCSAIDVGAFGSCSSLTSISFPKCISVNGLAFTGCSSLSEISLPNCKEITGFGAFQYCSNLSTVNLPKCVLVSNSAFLNCSNLTNVSLPVCKIVSASAFGKCSNLGVIALPNCSYIGYAAFSNCVKLSRIIIDYYDFDDNYNVITCTLSNSNAFNSTPFKGYSSYFSGTPIIYVPSIVLSDYKTATNWTYFSSYMVGY